MRKLESDFESELKLRLENDQQLGPEKLPEAMTSRVSWMGDLENGLDCGLNLRLDR